MEGATFPSLLLVAFIVLKLCGVIDWSWWWVFSPVWILFILAMLISMLTVLISPKRKRRD